MTQYGFTVRHATGEDASVLAALSEIPQALHVAAHPKTFKVPDPVELEQWYRSTLSRPGVHAWIAEIDATPVGYALALERQIDELPICFARRWLELDQIGVKASARRRGIARALADQVMALARARGLDSVELGTWAFNREAQRAFEALGFLPQRLRYARAVP